MKNKRKLQLNLKRLKNSSRINLRQKLVWLFHFPAKLQAAISPNNMITIYKPASICFIGATWMPGLLKLAEVH